MSKRTTYYKQYGISKDDVKKIRIYCRSKTFDKIDLLTACATEANPVISRELVDSIVKGLSWERLCGRGYVPYSKSDFYGYQRYCIYLFRNQLLLDPDYKSWNQLTIYDFIKKR